MLVHWLYVSTSRIPAPIAEDEVARLVHASLIVNGRLNVTGALLFTGHNFAQLIEGEADGVDRLRSAIQMDNRHEDIRTLGEGAWPHRLFVNWSLAYGGQSSYVARAVECCIEEMPSARHDPAARLVKLMAEFVFQGHG